MNIYNFLISLVCAASMMTAGCSGNIENNEPPASRAEAVLNSMTLEEKVWQMFFTTAEDITGYSVVTEAGDTTRAALEECPVGGIIYMGQNIKSREQVTEMISNTQSYSKIPLLISVDEEGGRVARLGNAGIIEKMPPMRRIGDDGDTKAAYDIGEYFGRELSSMGFNMDFAPVADVMTVGNNEDIGDRSFGEDPYLVADMVTAEINGFNSQNVSAVMKHFPGNGSTKANTHFGSGVIERTADEMRGCEFIPFKAGIDAGADGIMVAHVSAAGLTGDDTPSSLSPVIIRDYLRGELGFDKLVITDALNMGAVANRYSPADAAVMAVNAGADMLLMSPDVKSAAGAVIDKVKSGEISESRIDESVMRILTLKENKELLN